MENLLQINEPFSNMQTFTEEWRWKFEKKVIWEEMVDGFKSASIETQKTKKKYAPDANILVALNMNKQELKHGRFLLWLLDAKGSHAQARLFFDILIPVLIQSDGVLPSSIKNAKEKYIVERERSFPKLDDNGDVDIQKRDQVDLLIHNTTGDSQSRFAIFIENKIDAGEQEQQLSRYQQQLSKFAEDYSIPEENRWMVFLTPEGREGTTGNESISIIDVSYGKIASALKQLIFDKAIEADFIQRLVENYADLLKTKIIKPRKRK